jgi:hypothetical protein
MFYEDKVKQSTDKELAEMIDNLTKKAVQSRYWPETNRQITYVLSLAINERSARTQMELEKMGAGKLVKVSNRNTTTDEN